MNQKSEEEYLKILRNRLDYELNHPYEIKQTFLEIFDMDEADVIKWWNSLSEKTQKEIIHMVEEYDQKTSIPIESVDLFSLYSEDEYWKNILYIDMPIGNIAIEVEDQYIEKELEKTNFKEANEVITSILNKINTPKNVKRK